MVLTTMVLVGASLALAATFDQPPVMLDLGPVVPTPAPTPEHEIRRRLITTLTIQNSAEGESQISFEAMDVADQGKGKFRTIASKRYHLRDDREKLQALRKKIVSDIRALEHVLLEYAQVAGPPKERKPVAGGGGPAVIIEGETGEGYEAPEESDGGEE
jgi:hypothetical protein